MKEFGDILTETWKEYKKNFKVFLIIFLLLSVIPSLILFIAGIPMTLQFINIGEPTLSDILANLNYITLISFLGIVSLLFYVLMNSSFLYNSLYRKKQMNINQTLRGGQKYFWKYLLFLIVYLIFLAGLFILFIIPGIMFLVYWIFAPYILIKENKGIIESLRTSYYIVKGKWWSTFGYALLFFIIIILISILFSILSGITSIIIHMPLIISYGFLESFKLSTTTPLYSLSSGLVNNIFNWASNLITLPLGILFFKNLYLEYQNLKTKKK